MSEFFIPLLLLIIGFASGAFISNRFTSLKNKSETGKLEADISNTEEQLIRLERQIQETLSNLEAMRTEKDSYKDELIKKTTEFNTLEKKLLDQEEKLRIQFENLANKILDKKSDKFTEQNKKNLDLLLNPLHKKIESFEKKVETSQKESVGMHAALKQQLEGLKDLNQQMSKEAINLTKALKGDSKSQGDWGEIQLEIILEKAGLSNGIHFTSQGGYRDENENLKKPDFIINLPDNKHLIVDSKVSLTAYECYFSSENKEEKNNHLKKHIASIKNHIKELSEKEYTELYGINAPDYVLMFVPIEAALLIAFNENNKLYLEAFDKNVVLVSTSTLLATLSTVSSIWKQEDQKRNVIEIARQAGALYDKFVGLVEDLTGVGKKLDSAKNEYSAAMNKLVDGRGNLINSVEKIKKMGAKAKKSIPEQILLRSKGED